MLGPLLRTLTPSRRRLLYLSLGLLLLTAASEFVSAQQSACPAVRVRCPRRATENSNVRFRATIRNRRRGMNPTYQWTSTGTIVAGQGTIELTVNPRSAGGGSVTSTVTVGGINVSGCPNTIENSCTTPIMQPPPPNQPPTVGIAADRDGITVCPGDPSRAEPPDSIVKLFVTATDPDGDALTFRYKVNAGKILEAEGPNALWQLAGVKPGRYTATVAVSDGQGLEVVASVLVTVNSCLPANDATQPVPAKTGANEFGVWGGVSPFSSTLLGQTEDVRLGVVGLRYSRRLAEGEAVAFKYTLDAVPFLLMSFPRFELSPGGVVRRTRDTAYGAGLHPVGFQLNFRPRKRVQPFLGTSGGFIYFADPVPDARGKSFNFTFDVGGGVQLINPGGRALTFGYKYHHLSNAYRGLINPGFDSNLFYFGYSVFK